MVEGLKTYIDQSLEVAREANAQLAHLKEEGEALVAAANKEQGLVDIGFTAFHHLDEDGETVFR